MIFLKFSFYFLKLLWGRGWFIIKVMKFEDWLVTNKMELSFYI